MRIRISGRTSILCAIALSFLAIAAPALSQTIRYLSDEEALALEHETRFARLKRWAQTYGISPAPEFRNYVIPRSFMPADFHYDIPVLRIIFPENTFFDTASSRIKPSAIPIIRAMAATLDGDVPDVSVFVSGHADARGSDVYNHNLSVDRARAVAELLNETRTKPTPVWSIGFGKSVPLYPNTDDRNMSYNRRVEFLLGSRPDAIAYWLQDQVVDVCRSSDAANRLRCMRDFQKERKQFVAERVVTRKVSIGEVRKSVPPPAPERITIRLNERRVRVQSIEH